MVYTIITCWEPGLLIIYKIETRNWKILKRQYIISSIIFTGISNINQQQHHFAFISVELGSKSNGSLTIYSNYKGLFQQFQQIYGGNKVIRINLMFIESQLFCSNYDSHYLEYFKFNQNVNRYEFNIDTWLKQEILAINSQFRTSFRRVQSIRQSFCSHSIFGCRKFIHRIRLHKIKLWKLNKDKLQISQQIEFQSSINTVSVSNNKNSLVIGFLDGTIKIFA